jgi:hypothetical protein
MGTLFHTRRQKSGAQVSAKFGAQMSPCNSGKKAQIKCPAPELQRTWNNSDLHATNLLLCLYMYIKQWLLNFFSPAQDFFTHGDVTITSEGLLNLDPCMLSTQQSFWAGRNLCRATLVRTQGLGFSGLFRRTSLFWLGTLTTHTRNGMRRTYKYLPGSHGPYLVSYYDT